MMGRGRTGVCAWSGAAESCHTKGHHFLPQFLLRGSRIARKEHCAFIFRQDMGAKEANIRGIAKQRYFHSHPAESNLEQLISIRESEHANLVA